MASASMMSKAEDVYFESIRRKDKKYNFYIVPLSSINEKNEYTANGLNQDSIVIESVYIDGKLLKVFNFNGPLILSLKPGKYRVKINFKVNASLSTKMNYIVSKRRNEKVASVSLGEKLNYSGSKETIVTIGESGDYYALFKARISTTWKSKSGYNELIWYLDGCTHGYEFYQTDLRTISSLCSYWEGYKKKYNYPHVDIDDILDVWANSN